MILKKLLKQAQFHGLNKLDDTKFRWVWITSLFLLLIAAVNIVMVLVMRYLDKPTYIVRKEKWQTLMEFPSVQLCPEVFFPDYKIEEFLSQITYPDDLSINYIRAIIRKLAAFYSPDVTYEFPDLQKIEYLLDYNKLDVYTASKALTAPCEKTLIKCRLFGQMKNCSELFKLEITQNGYCCIFNSRSLRSEMIDYGIHKVMPEVEYITPFVGFGSSLMIAVNQSENVSNIDLSYKWMSIDGGQAYVDAAINGTPLSPGNEMWFGHYNEGFHIDEYTGSLDPKLRGCRLISEKLTWFPIYHKKYCQLECEIWYLMENCNCIYMTSPQPPNMPICRVKYLPCARRAMSKFNKGACQCPATCDVDTDLVEISSYRLIQHSAFFDSFYEDLDLSKTSVVRVFIKQREVKTMSRRSYYAYEDLFSQLGGIFNMFFGCSILSILEILQIIKYAFTSWRGRRKTQREYIKTKKEGKKTKI